MLQNKQTNKQLPHSRLMSNLSVNHHKEIFRFESNRQTQPVINQ